MDSVELQEGCDTSLDTPLSARGTDRKDETRFFDSSVYATRKLVLSAKIFLSLAAWLLFRFCAYGNNALDWDHSKRR
jgi:hypothetical protein